MAIRAGFVANIGAGRFWTEENLCNCHPGRRARMARLPVHRGPLRVGHIRRRLRQSVLVQDAPGGPRREDGSEFFHLQGFMITHSVGFSDT